MSEENQLPKFKLARDPDEQRKLKEQEQVRSADAEVPAQPLKLKPVEATKTFVSSDADEISVVDILDDAYSPEKERLRRAKMMRRITVISLVLLLFFVSTGLTLGYAHLSKEWRQLEPQSWYLPFILSVALSVAALVKSYQFMTRRHSSISLTLTGLCIAVALANWNVTILHVACQIGEAPSGMNTWQPSSTAEMLIAYELNICRGNSSSSYTSASAANYTQMFQNMPRSQWEHYFKQYLTGEELEEVSLSNIDQKMGDVAIRMEQVWRKQWAEFDAIYKDPPFSFRVKQWALMPYTYLFKQL